MLRKTLLAITAATISVTASAQQNSSPSDSITNMACQSYKSSLVNMLRTASNGLSDETLRKNNQPPLTDSLKQQTTRDILESVIESEANPAMRRIITKASNAYIRSQSIDSFERGLAKLVPTCVEIRSTENRQQTQQFNQGQPQNPTNDPTPNRNRSDNQKKNGKRSTLPSTDSYL